MSSVYTLGGLERLLVGLPRAARPAVVRDGEATVIGAFPSEIVQTRGPHALQVLERLQRGWWAGFLSYDLGRVIERVPDLTPRSPALPDLALARYEARLRWHPRSGVTVEGEGLHRRALQRLLDDPPPARRSPSLRRWESSLDRPAWGRSVQHILEHLRAGDCYQVNLTRRLWCATTTDPVALFCALRTENPAPHAALIDLGKVAVVSASPEQFLRRDGSAIRTRPIKGTAPEPGALRQSAKDRAENVMIVDLARNDLGRVCEYGSVHVPSLCSIEQHPGLYHLVSTVEGTLRPDVGWNDLIRATFPPASVTGCPKPRVLEIIETLEPVPRGVYCGSVGFIDADNDIADFNVAIRTFTATGDGTYFGVGGAIVADSDPGAEWEETELKARRLLATAAGGI